MDILYLLIPVSALVVLGILGVFGWALHAGQFDDLDQHGEQILDAVLDADAASLDPYQAAPSCAAEESSPTTRFRGNRGSGWLETRNSPRR